MSKMKWIAIVAFFLLCSGCSSTASIVKAMSEDTATICLRGSTIYGSFSMMRTSAMDVNLKCSPEGGLEVTGLRKEP